MIKFSKVWSLLVIPVPVCVCLFKDVQLILIDNFKWYWEALGSC